MGFVLLALGILFFSLNNVIWKKTIHNFQINYLIFLKCFFTSLIFGLIIYFKNHNTDLIHTTWQEVSINSGFLIGTILLSVFSFFGLFFYLKSLENENAALTIAVSSINIFGILSAFIILGESWKNTYFIVFTIIFYAIYLLYKQSLSSKKTNSIKYAILASFFWGIAYTLFKIPIERYGAIVFTFILELTICIFCLLFFIRKWIPFKNIPIKYLSINIICTVLASYFFYQSYLCLNTREIVIFQRLDIPVSLFLSFLLFKEKPNQNQLIATLLIFTALLLTAFDA